MRVLMLGWEFPPFISGGLGTACYGLTKALDRLGHEVVFVLPKAVERSRSSHIRLLSPAAGGDAGSGQQAPEGGVRTGIREETSGRGFGGVPGHQPAEGTRVEGFAHAEFLSVASAGFSSPYPRFGAQGAEARAGMFNILGVGTGAVQPESAEGEVVEADWVEASAPGAAGTVGGGAGPGYEGDMVENAARYARLVVTLSRGERFDVIHAHDWMTFPAGQAVARATGKPLVVHVHSTEFDRAGNGANQRVYDIERRGMHGALRVIAVSNLTRNICTGRYGVDAGKVDVVWNGIDSAGAQPVEGEGIRSVDKIVLFLGRITMQKGPEYFIRAAKRVLEKVADVKFVVAGSGDMAVRMIEEAASLGIGHKVLFTGFLRGSQVDRVFQMADCYVMPSVSEPFGIAPLEAMRNDVPVIISKQSGVSEVLTHALKVDFWDIDQMANKIVAVLRHPPLGETLREHGAFEVRKLTWDGAATKCVESYKRAIGAQGRRLAGHAG
jgi:glycogen synthase